MQQIVSGNKVLPADEGLINQNKGQAGSICKWDAGVFKGVEHVIGVYSTVTKILHTWQNNDNDQTPIKVYQKEFVKITNLSRNNKISSKILLLQIGFLAILSLMQLPFFDKIMNNLNRNILNYWWTLINILPCDNKTI